MPAVVLSAWFQGAALSLPSKRFLVSDQSVESKRVWYPICNSELHVAGKDAARLCDCQSEAEQVVMGVSCHEGLPLICC
jgi:hypothetical protein